MADITLLEYNQSGQLERTYTTSGTSQHLIAQRSQTTKSTWEQTLDVFMPAGYPASVTDDYFLYQTFDSLQAFASAIAGMLASRAVLEGVGVGDAKAHPTTALLLSVFQDSFGRLATILFAHRLGSALEPECKMWRLAADVFNDAAMIMDCLSPAFPKSARIVLYSFSSMLRALCGVAAGSSKATLSSHFAKWDNLGDVNAKDSSQETVISLMGMMAGSIVVFWVSKPIATWITLLILLAIHLLMNWAAVRAVSMDTLNRQRANLVFSHLLAKDQVLTPKLVSAKERIFERDGVLRFQESTLGHAYIGVSAAAVVQPWLRSQVSTLDSAIRAFENENYFIGVDSILTRHVQVFIGLKRQCEPHEQLKAWLHALIIARQFPDQSVSVSHDELRRRQISIENTKSGGKSEDDYVLKLVQSTLSQTNLVFDTYCARLRAAGWDLSIGALETKFGPRIDFTAADGKKDK